MSHKIEHFKNVLGKHGSGEMRLNMLFCWVKSGNISYKMFKELLKYNKEIDYKISTKGEVDNNEQP
jgi:hypothetical protein